MFEYTLKKPVSYNGQIYEVLHFEFDNLTGRDALDVEKELISIGDRNVVTSFYSPYVIRLAVKACREPVGADIFDEMCISDFNKIKAEARHFLLDSEV